MKTATEKEGENDNSDGVDCNWDKFEKQPKPSGRYCWALWY
jgi:hypothetical protein